MKTVFKVGDKVYDQINFPNKEGEVTEIERDVDGYWYVRVDFSGDEYYYNTDGSYTLNSTPTLSTKPYEVEFRGFEQKVSVPTYESVKIESLINGGYVSILNGVELPDEETAKAFEALAKLIWLRDYYNEGWLPDWNDSTIKYSIELEGVEICKRHHVYNQRVLTFKSEEIIDKFSEEQKELLEIAKYLL